MTHQPHSNQNIKSNNEARLQKRAFVVWFTGLPCSGKTTLAKALHQELQQQNIQTFILDGDEMRKGLSKDLGYSIEDRKENIRRAAEASKLLMEAGVITLSCFIAPTEALREMVKQIVGKENVIEVFVKCPVEVCEQRDVKGMYRKARNNELKDFTGVSSVFEEPADVDLVLDTSVLDVSACVARLTGVVQERLMQRV